MIKIRNLLIISPIQYIIAERVYRIEVSIEICSRWFWLNFDNCRDAKRKHCVLLFKYEHVGLSSILGFCCCFCSQCVHQGANKYSNWIYWNRCENQNNKKRSLSEFFIIAGILLIVLKKSRIQLDRMVWKFSAIIKE